MTLDVYTHVEGEDDKRVAGELDRILHPIAPTNEKLELAFVANSSFIKSKMVAGVGFEPTTFGL
jgi:hypothetical protein